MKRLFTLLIRWFAMAMAVILLAVAYGGTVDPRSWALPSILSMALPIVAVLSMLLLATSVLVRQWVAAIIVGVALLLSAGPIRTVWPMSWNSTPDNPSRSFSVMTWNVAGFGKKATQCILDADPDVVLLQEASVEGGDYMSIYNTSDNVKALMARYPYSLRGCSDVAIMSKYPFTAVPDATMRNRVNITGEGSYHTYGRIFDLDIQGQKLRIVSVHMQSFGLTGSDKQLYKDIATLNRKVNTREELSEVKHTLGNKLAGASRRRAGEAHAVRAIADAAPANLIVCGDFNDTPSSYTYRTILGSDLSDAFVDCGTWPINTFNRDGMYFKIDHMLYRGDLKAVSTRLERVDVSDHYPQIITFEWQNP